MLCALRLSYSVLKCTVIFVDALVTAVYANLADRCAHKV
jgi:hypothetical protein